MHMLHQNRTRGLAVERKLPCEKLIGQDPERVDITSLIGLFARGRFRRDVRRRSEHAAVLCGRRSDPLGLEDAGDPEVDELHEVGVPAAPHEVDVLGLDVTVHDSSRMHSAEPGAKLHGHDQRALEGRWSLLIELVGK